MYDLVRYSFVLSSSCSRKRKKIVIVALFTKNTETCVTLVTLLMDATIINVIYKHNETSVTIVTLFTNERTLVESHMIGCDEISLATVTFLLNVLKLSLPVTLLKNLTKLSLRLLRYFRT